MKTVTRLLKTKLSFSLMLCLVATSSIYFSIPGADKRGADKAKTKTTRQAKARRAAVPRPRKQPPIAGTGDAKRLLNWVVPAGLMDKLGEWNNDAGASFGEKAGLGIHKRGPKRADEPDKAIQYYLQKRLPEGEQYLPVERYFEAMEEMRRMPLHSTADNRLVSREELRNAAPDQQRLGTWTALGPGNIGGRTRAILINPQDPNVMYAAGVAGGVWKSTNAGASWTPLADLIANIAVCSLAFDPKNPGIIYAGTGEGFPNVDGVRGAGIFKTTDAGATWARLTATANNPNFYAVNDLIVSTTDSNRVYAATSTGIWRSLDAGVTWTQVVVRTAAGGCQDLAARTDQTTDFLLAACGNLAQATVFRKTDAEAAGTWETVLSDPGMGRTAVAFAPSNQNVVYALSAAFSGTYIHGLHAFFRSDNGGASGSWAPRVRNTGANFVNTGILSDLTSATAIECKFGAANFFNGQSWYDLALAVDPVDADRVWAGSIDVVRSDDGGANWGAAAFAYDATGGNFVYGRPNQLHPDQHFFVFHPQYNGTTNQQLFIGNDGGIWRTSNARAAVSTGPRAYCDSSANKVLWEPLNNGYAVTQFYHGSVYPDGKTYLGGTQDNGTPRGSDADGPNNWKQIFLADGGYSAVDFTNSNNLYVSTQGGGFRKSTDNGATFSSATLGLAGTFSFIQALGADPSDPQRYYTVGDPVFRTSNGMANWTNIGSLRSVSLTTGVMTAAAVAPTDANHAMFGMSDGSIVRTTRALALGPANPFSATLDRAARPRTANVSWIAYDPNDRNIAYATYSTFGGAHVFRTTNGGESWTNIDGTGTTAVPDIPVHCIVVDTSNTARLYAGTDLGIFVSTDGGTTWAVENTGFANVVTESLVLNTAGGVTSLYAFTHGRGAYKVTANMSGCNFALAQTGRTVAAAGGDLTVDVNVAPAGCNWKAESNVPWTTVQPGAGGSTSGTVGLKVEANRMLSRRIGTIAIAGRSFTVTQAGQPDLDSPTLRITTPNTTTVNTTAGAVNVAGAAADNLLVTSVSWRSNRGLSGTASGTTNWTIAGLPVLTGRNEITVTASDEAGNVSGASVLTVNSTPSSVLTTVVGTGTFGYNGENIPAVLANITNPSGTMFFDGGGNFYFGDFNGARARKVSSAGLITTVAGTGVAGFSGDGGKATDAQLAQPRGAVADSNGNVYILDSGNQRIRRVTAGNGNISTFAGTGAAGFGGDGGPATAAQFDFGGIGAIALDTAGNLFISDSNNNRIRRVAADTGIINTIAGGAAGFSGDGGPAASALINLSYPATMTFDAMGDLYFADRANQRIRKITISTGVISTVAGTGVSGFNGDGTTPAATALSFPTSVAFDAAGNMVIADSGNNRIRRVRPASALRTVSSVSAASFSMTAGLAAEEIASAFGMNLASSMASATTVPLPTTLSGTTVKVRDNPGVERIAPLFYVSPDQINFLVPSGTAAGLATVTVTNSAGEISTGTVAIFSVVPSLFAANSAGTGVAAAVVFRRNAAGVDSYEPVVRFDTVTSRFVAVPIDLSVAGDQVFLIPYGTGLRGLSGLAGVSATIGGV
ncbi:MAG: hypothetical protein ACREEM_04760, partial [Blastocatellia bacterium]